MAIFTARDGSLYFNARAGYPGSNETRLMYVLRCKSLSTLRAWYLALLSVSVSVLIVAIVTTTQFRLSEIYVSRTDIPKTTVALLLPLVVTIFIAMKVSISRKTERVSLLYFSGNLLTSAVVYLYFIVTQVAAALVVLVAASYEHSTLKARMLLTLAVLFSAGFIFCIARLINWIIRCNKV
jgi:hypothetical protein